MPRDDGRRDQNLMVKNLQWGEGRRLDDGSYEVSLSGLLLVRDEAPLNEVEYEIYVGNVLRGGSHLLETTGRFAVTLTFIRPMSVELKAKGTGGVRRFNLGTPEIPEFISKPRKPCIRVFDKFSQGNQLVVHLDVADKDGNAIGGKIHYLDDDGTGGSLKKEIIVRKSSPVISRFNLKGDGREITLRLASDLGVSVSINVPAKVSVVLAPVASAIPKPQPPMALYAAYKVGYNRTRKLKPALTTPTATP